MHLHGGRAGVGGSARVANCSPTGEISFRSWDCLFRDHITDYAPPTALKMQFLWRDCTLPESTPVLPFSAVNIVDLRDISE